MYCYPQPPATNRKLRCREPAGGAAQHVVRLGILAPKVAPEPVCSAVPLGQPGSSEGRGFSLRHYWHFGPDDSLS